jgi:hypothetical protein
MAGALRRASPPTPTVAADDLRRREVASVPVSSAARRNIHLLAAWRVRAAHEQHVDATDRITTRESIDGPAHGGSCGRNVALQFACAIRPNRLRWCDVPRAFPPRHHARPERLSPAAASSSMRPLRSDFIFCAADRLQPRSVFHDAVRFQPLTRHAPGPSASRTAATP